MRIVEPELAKPVSLSQSAAHMVNERPSNTSALTKTAAGSPSTTNALACPELLAINLGSIALASDLPLGRSRVARGLGQSLPSQGHSVRVNLRADALQILPAVTDV